MGLKTTNYKIEKLNLTIPEAYAWIKNLRISGKVGEAEFVIQQTREMAEKAQPITNVFVRFDVDRNENPYVTAYTKAKSRETITIWDEEKQEYVEDYIYGAFYDWNDDIV